jgi:hypothetical protein
MSPEGDGKAATVTPTKLVQTNRHAETIAFLIGVFGLGVNMIAETLLNMGFVLGPCEKAHAGVPWAVVLGSIVLIVPKTIGRATAGKALLETLSTLRLRGRGSATAEVTAHSPGGEEHKVAGIELPPGGGSAEVTIPTHTGDMPTPDEDVEIAQAGKAREDAEP